MYKKEEEKKKINDSRISKPTSVPNDDNVKYQFRV